jgi:hypothetical protein
VCTCYVSGPDICYASVSPPGKFSSSLKRGGETTVELGEHLLFLRHGHLLGVVTKFDSPPGGPYCARAKREDGGLDCLGARTWARRGQRLGAPDTEAADRARTGAGEA